MSSPSPVLPALLCAASFGAVPAHAFADEYKILGVRWNVEDGPVPFSLNKAGVDDVDGDADLDAVRRAFRTWSCIPGSKLRFQEIDVDGPKDLDLDDGINTVFWDEDGSFHLGAGTLGITVGNNGSPDEIVQRDNADIVFNGFDSTWSAGDPITDTDVESIAIHEIGHMLGLDHPCDLDQGGNEVDCLDDDGSVMTPAWSGENARTPTSGDVEGLLSLYAADEGDDATCDGPFQKGERCGGDCDCVEGLLCVPGQSVSGQGGEAVCATTCSSQNADCGFGFACVLGAKEGDDAPGACVKLAPGGKKPVASSCGADGECEEGLCLAATAVGRSICNVHCSADDECGDGLRCVDDVCVGAGAAASLPCPGQEGCACNATRGAPLWLALAAFMRRRRS